MKKSVDRELNNLYISSLKRVIDKNKSIKESIELDYQDKLDKLKNKRQERLNKLTEYLEKVENYSKFDLDVIGPAIADLFTLYKGEEYVYDYSWDNKSIPGVCKHFVRSEKNLRKKVNIKLTTTSLPKDIVFYNYFRGLEVLSENLLLKRYAFLREFIMYVVDYRLKNDIKEMDLKTLKQLEDKYVKENIETIKGVDVSEEDIQKIREKIFLDIINYEDEPTLKK